MYRTDRAYHATQSLPVGEVALRVGQRGVAEVRILETGCEAVRVDRDERASRLLGQLVAHILDGTPRPEVAVEPAGTAFQRRVWRELQLIARGQTRTYGEIARRLDTSARAVGGACRANPILLLIPCHRVVPVHGTGGFSGAVRGHWPAVKAWLLEREGAAVR
jgi:methylated-DNA-[protein]-cysteine S-methyltransferase